MLDVAVVGAGPAGGMAAWGLASSGLDVVVLEQSPVVGEPVQCGEALSCLAFENCGLRPTDDFVVGNVEGYRMFSPDGTEYLVRTQGYHVRRDLMDRHVVGLAEDAGAQLLTSTRVTSATLHEEGWRLVTGEGEVVARVLVAADGPRSALGRAAGLERSPRIARGLQYSYPPSDALRDDHLRFYAGSSYPGGYGWSFDRGDELKVGVVSTANPRPYMDALCKRLGLDPGERLGVTGGMIPQGGPNPRMAGRAIVTVGDAAGLTNPISSGGIHAALYSGRVAAEVVAGALDSGTPDDLSAYEERIRGTPLCNPLVLEARQLVDRLNDEQWDLLIRVLRSRDDHQLKRMGPTYRFLTSTSLGVSQLGRLRQMRSSFDVLSTWGW